MAASQAYEQCVVERNHKRCTLPAVCRATWDDGHDSPYCAKHRYIAESWLKNGRVLHITEKAVAAKSS